MVLVIGYGNPVRGDDGIGWRASQLVEKAALPYTEVLSVHQLTPELAETISHANLVIFIDAAEGGLPGIWKQEEVRPVLSRRAAFTHHSTPAGLVSSAGALFGHVPEAVIFTMSAGTFDFGIGLSPQVETALPAMVEEIKATVLKEQHLS